MLRSLIIAVGAALTVAGGIMLMFGVAGGIGCLIAGIVVVVGTLFEQVIYKRVHGGAPGPGWVRTAERFVDPATGKTVTVYEQPKTGERAYIED